MANEAPTADKPANGKRKIILSALALAFLIAGLGYAIFWWTSGQFHQKTEDAYVAGNQVQVSAQAPGTVTAIFAEDTQSVKQGQTLLQLDETDAKIALEQAETALAQAVREVRNLKESAGQSRSVITAREAEVARARDDYRRRSELVRDKAVSQEELQHAKSNLDAANAALESARFQYAGAQATVGKMPVDQHPQVAAAKSHVLQAYVALARTRIVAPVSGFVAKRSVQLGQRINAGVPLLVIIPSDQLWVDANLKEDQLRNVRIGQPAEVLIDLYGGKVVYHGRVLGLGAGTGGAFALLPPQNATGNWIKVVQRIPVRIQLDASELSAHPLRVGLSAQVKIDTHDNKGALTESIPAGKGYSTPVFSDVSAGADALIDKIIKANL